MIRQVVEIESDRDIEEGKSNDQSSEQVAIQWRAPVNQVTESPLRKQCTDYDSEHHHHRLSKNHRNHVGLIQLERKRSLRTTINFIALNAALLFEVDTTNGLDHHHDTGDDGHRDNRQTEIIW